MTHPAFLQIALIILGVVGFLQVLFIIYLCGCSHQEKKGSRFMGEVVEMNPFKSFGKIVSDFLQAKAEAMRGIGRPQLVIIESPYAGDVETHTAYAKRCMADCLRRFEAPYASHLLYTQVLDDLKPSEREMGMAAGWAWMMKADKVVVYSDYGISGGMHHGIAQANRYGIEIEHRKIGQNERA